MSAVSESDEAGVSEDFGGGADHGDARPDSTRSADDRGSGPPAATATPADHPGGTADDPRAGTPGETLRPGAAAAGFAADPWRELAAMTPARIALGRSGASLPTREVLAFGLAHARARDAVHAPLDVAAVGAAIEALGLETLVVDSAAPDRPTYLRRPDAGRRLSAHGRAALAGRAADANEPAPDIVFVVADGLSAAAIHTNAAAMLAAFLPEARRAGWRIGPAVIARQARVALGDEIGELLGARLVVVLVGERPGLSSPDSLGLYLTFAPKRGRSDAERNCISNVRHGGLGHHEAAATLAFLARGALRLGLTGVKLKDAAGAALPAAEG